MSLTTVSLISADPDFASTVIARWQCERIVPGFVTLGASPSQEALLAPCDLAITGPAPCEALVPILRTLEVAGRQVVCLVPDSSSASTFRQANSRVVILREHEGWPDSLVTLGSEVLRRVEASARIRRLEQSLADAEQNATLGRYMLDMRHGLNNALTSILGNSELLLLEPGVLSPEQRDQVSTMHSMTLRIHEILQRFTSLELEMKLYSQSHHEIPLLARTILSASTPQPELVAEPHRAHGGGVS